MWKIKKSGYNTSMKGHRINWIDELKGFVLIMICIGHITGMVSSPPVIKFIADVLTMIGVPMFFFLSGLLFSIKMISTKDYFFKKTQSLLIPYFLLSFLFTLLDPYVYNSTYLVDVLHYPRFTLPESFSINPHLQASLEFFVGDIFCTFIGISSRATLPLWFVFVLYFVTIIYFYIHRICKSQILLMLIAIVAFVIALILNALELGSYLKIGPILMAFFFYSGGVIVSKKKYWIDNKPSGMLILFSIPFVVITILLAPTFLEQIFFVNGRFAPDRPLSYLMLSISGIIGSLLLCAGISKIDLRGLNIMKGILRNIARNALIILAIHYFFLCVFSLYIKKFIPIEWHFVLAILFVIIGCIIAIVVFRTRLYMFIGGRKAYQDIKSCLSIK